MEEMMKKTLLLSLAFALLAAFPLAAQAFPQEVNDGGSHVFEIPISALAKNKVVEKIVIQNNSSREIDWATCTLSVGGKEHELKKMPPLPVGKSREFEGYDDDEMKDELKAAFGDAGKISAKNRNSLRFTFSFGNQEGLVCLRRVLKSEKDICFEVVDSPNAPAQSAPSGKKVTIDGETYLLIDGQAYRVRE